MCLKRAFHCKSFYKTLYCILSCNVQYQYLIELNPCYHLFEMDEMVLGMMVKSDVTRQSKNRSTYDEFRIGLKSDEKYTNRSTS